MIGFWGRETLGNSPHEDVESFGLLRPHYPQKWGGCGGGLGIPLVVHAFVVHLCPENAESSFSPVHASLPSFDSEGLQCC